MIDPFNEDVIGPRGICFLANTHLNKNVEVKNIKHRINGAVDLDQHSPQRSRCHPRRR